LIFNFQLATTFQNIVQLVSHTKLMTSVFNQTIFPTQTFKIKKLKNNIDYGIKLSN